MDAKLKQVRALFNIAHLDKKDCYALISLTENNEDVVIMAYYASAIMISSKYIINPFKILAVFNKGKDILEDLISENFDNTELRFLRYSIQLNTPKFAGYYRNIEEDRKILIAYVKSHSGTNLTKHMMVFLQNTQDKILNFI